MPRIPKSTTPSRRSIRDDEERRYDFRLREDIVQGLLDSGLTVGQIVEETLRTAATKDLHLPPPTPKMKRLSARMVNPDYVEAAESIAAETGHSIRAVLEVAAEVLLAERADESEKQAPAEQPAASKPPKKADKK